VTRSPRGRLGRAAADGGGTRSRRGRLSRTAADGGAKAPSSGRSGAKPARAMPGGAEAVRAERQARLAAAAAAAAASAPSATSAVAGAAAEVAVLPPSRLGVGAIEGRRIIASAWIGTAVFVLATVVATFVPAARIPVVVVDLLLLLAGSGLYFWGWGVAAGRSREDQITLWNLILLEDVAPNPVRARLLGALAVEVVVAAATCWITAALAFGWLVPVWGLAHCELWGARYGVFPARMAPGGDGHNGMRRRDRR
jgi:hypothetical protein